MTIDCKSEQYKIDGKQFPCSTSIAMEFIGGKYKTVILFHLRNGSLRYNELRKFMPVVTERTLSLQLKQLEQDGLLKRTVYASKPPLKVEYELTDFGKTAIPALLILAQWGREIALQHASVVKI